MRSSLYAACLHSVSHGSLCFVAIEGKVLLIAIKMLARAGRHFLGRTGAARSGVRAVAAAHAAPISSLRAETTQECLLAANIGNGRDAEDYALLAAANPKDVRRIVVVKVGGEVITKEPETLARSLKFLQSQGLQPVVVHGGGPQLNDELKKAGVEPNYIGGA